MNKEVSAYICIIICLILYSGQCEDGAAKITLIKQVSLAFVIDDTGSMGDDIADVRVGSQKIMDEFLSRSDNPIKNWILSVFNDPGITPVLITEDTALFRQKLNAIRVHGGGDCPELAMGGIKQAVEAALPGSYIYVFTDASAKDHHIFPAVNTLALKKNCQVTFVLTGKCTNNPSDPQFTPYVTISKSTGGELFELGKKTEVKEVLNFVRESLNARTVYIISQSLVSGRSTTLIVDINKDIGKMTVVVTGKNPSIQIKDPNGNVQSGVSVLSLDSTKVVKIDSPMVGKWICTVNANSLHSSVQVSAVSEMNFKFGFSQKSVTSIEDTFDKPVKDVPNYLYIKPTPFKGWIPEKVEILGTDGSVHSTFSITPTSTPGLYVIPPFTPPTINLFKIMVHGKDLSNHPLKRVIKGSIDSQPPEPPKIIDSHKTINLVVKYKDPAVLECFVTGTEPTIQWNLNGALVVTSSRIVKEERNQKLVFTSAEYTDSGTYICSASNKMGSTKRTYHVTVEGPPAILKPEPEHQVLKIGEKAVLECDVSGNPKPTIDWKKDGVALSYIPTTLINKEGKEVVIPKSLSMDSGVYTCTATNSQGSRVKEITIEVSEPKWTAWGSWSSCSKTCDDGIMTRTRHCILPSRIKEKEKSLVDGECSGSNTESTTCNLKECTIDGGWSDWTEWTPCSRTCAIGEKSRGRECNNPEPKGGGRTCEGDPYETEPCMSRMCIYEWTDWSKWTECSVSCGGGKKTRSRMCLKPSSITAIEGKCIGSDEAVVDCNEHPCPVDGGWSPWTEWSECSKTCDAGQQRRLRYCNSPKPAHGGKNCVGASYELKLCNIKPCAINGGWSPWNEWSRCSVTCGYGLRERLRECNNPKPAHRGKICPGPLIERQRCFDKPCPVDGGWSKWTEWTDCSKTCDEGQQTRFRYCNSPKPAHGGKECIGPSDELQLCNLKSCAINGGWSPWYEWSHCSETCGYGMKERVRVCNNPKPAHGGEDCPGSTHERQRCFDKPCPVDGGLSNWSEWTTCSTSCGYGWRQRTRTCTNPPPQHDGRDCNGPLYENNRCIIRRCPIDGGWSEWSDWTTCSTTCEKGVQYRKRSCNNPSPAFNGKKCEGQFQNVRVCNGPVCPIHGGWSEWGEWGVCSVACGTGSVKRKRTCTNPEPKYGGRDCIGDIVEWNECQKKPCPPKSVTIHFYGILNDINIDTYLEVNPVIQLSKKKITIVTKMERDIIDKEKEWFPHLPFLLQSASWSSAWEAEEALNGFSITNGYFETNTNITFQTGDNHKLHLKQVGHGLDSERSLRIEVEINGNLPFTDYTSRIKFNVNDERHILIGSGKIFSNSKNYIKINKYEIEYNTNHLTTYTPSEKFTPPLIQKLTKSRIKNFKTNYEKPYFFEMGAKIIKAKSSSCPKGFRKDSVNNYCNDIDECLRNRPCEQICINEIGSYYCECNANFVLRSDGSTCEEKVKPESE